MLILLFLKNIFIYILGEIVELNEEKKIHIYTHIYKRPSKIAEETSVT